MSKEIATTASDELRNQLASMFPQDNTFVRPTFKRLVFKSQDVTEGKGKDKKVVVEAGTFFREEESDEINPDTQKKEWVRTELGSAVEGIIMYQRKQLRHYDEATEEFTNSPLYDTDEDIVPLFKGRTKIAEGTPKDLRAAYAYQAEDGKTKSKLEENRVLYILVDGEVLQLNLRGSSMYSFLSYARKQQVNEVITKMSSEPQQKGSIEWNQMTFNPTRVITEEEAQQVISMVTEMREMIQLEKDFYATQQTGDASAVQIEAGQSLPSGQNDDDF